MAVFALIQHFTWDGRFYWMRPNTQSTSPFGPFVNHNHFAGYIEMLIPLPLALAIIKSARAEARMFYLFAAAVMCVSVLASLSRGGMISVMISATVVVVWAWSRGAAGKSHRRRSSSKLIGIVRNTAIVVVILACAGLGLLWIGPDRLADRITQSGISGDAQKSEAFYESRGWIWEDTLRMIKANPVFGTGLGAYETAYPIYRKEDREMRVRQAHNDYLQIVADCGLIGGLLAAWFIFNIFRAIRRGALTRDPFIAALALGSGGGILAIMVHSLVDFNLQLPSNALMFLLLVAAASNAAALASRQEVMYEPVRVDSEKLRRERAMPAATVR
jgi:O-antigen ligase